MPCCARMAPINTVISRMIGTARQPTRSSWCTIDVKRKVDGRSATRLSATSSDPSICASKTRSAPTDAMVMPTLSSVAMMLFGLGGGGESVCVPE